MKVAFRTDASLKIGTGHAMRCLTLAKALCQRGVECRFISRAHLGNLNYRLREAGFRVDVLPFSDESNLTSETGHTTPAHADWLGTDWQTDASQAVAVLSGDVLDWLIVDHYALDIRWERELRPYAQKILVIDDLADRAHDCDLLLDQNLVANLDSRYGKYLHPHCARLLGPHFALLGSEYAELHLSTPPRAGMIRRILIYFGGADQHNMTALAIDAFLALETKDIELDVVINPQSPYAALVREKASGHRQITVHEELPSLSTLMSKADLAIGAGGATTWERCCVGLPSIVITLAENQREIAAELHRQGLIFWMGDHDFIDETNFKRTLANTLQTELDVTWSVRCKDLVDGKGAQRVADIVTLGPKTKLRAHLAQRNDEALLLRWANDPLVRANSFNQNKIDQITHQRWYFSRLRDQSKCQIFIIKTENEIPIGQVRFEKMSEEWEIHYAIDSFARGRGIGVNMLRSAISSFTVLGSIKLQGWVRPDNLASRKIFLKMGFVEEIGVQGIKYSLYINV